jgi:hypothetical protein
MGVCNGSESTADFRFQRQRFLKQIVRNPPLNKHTIFSTSLSIRNHGKVCRKLSFKITPRLLIRRIPVGIKWRASADEVTIPIDLIDPPDGWPVLVFPC